MPGLSTFWPFGAVFLTLVVAGLATRPLTHSWIPTYLAAGALPLLAWPWARSEAVKVRRLTTVLGAIGVAAATVLGLKDLARTARPVALAILVLAAAAVLGRHALARYMVRIGRPPVTYRMAIYAAGVAVIAAGIAGSVPTWIRRDSFMFDLPWSYVALAAGVVVAGAVLVDLSAPSHVSSRAARIADLLAILALIAVCFALPGTMALPQLHHWSFYIGPADQWRFGRTPAWDVPSQYGILNEILVGSIGNSSWNAMYLVSGTADALRAVAVYAAIRNWRSGILNAAITWALTVASSLWFFNEGVNEYPSLGGMRYCWAVVLVALVGVLSRVRSEAAERWILGFGTAVWAVGSVWSAESAVFCTCAWIPVALYMGMRRNRQWLWWVAAGHALALAGSLLGVAIIYWAHGRLLPDPHMVVDFAVAFGGGVGFTRQLAAGGPLWVFAVILAIILGTGVLALRRGRIDCVAALASAWLTVWIVASRYATELWPGDVAHAAAVMVPAAFLSLRLLRDLAGDRLFALGVAVVVPYLAMTVAAPLGGFHSTRSWVHEVVSHGFNADNARPLADPQLQALLVDARVQPSDPIVYANHPTITVMMPEWRSYDGTVVRRSPTWLPADPLGELNTLSPQRREIYYQRFAEHGQGGGWLITANHPEVLKAALYLGTLDDFRLSLERRFRVVREYSNDAWTLSLYEARNDV